MLLFQKAFHEGLVSGRITLTFRRWAKPHVKPGGRYRCHPIGVLEVDAVAPATERAITEVDARRAGFATKNELLAYLEAFPAKPGTTLYRVELHHAGDGDRVELALEDDLSPDDVAAIAAKLAKLDAKGPWTAETLAIVARRPRIAASKLAAELGRETLPFKVDVRKLKRLGLTMAFEVGYELSPRGKAYLAARPARRATSATPGSPASRRPTGRPARSR